MNLGKSKKILVISDTHIGSNFENMTYLDMVYEYALKNNITKIIHGGDILDGLVDMRKTKYTTYKSQIEHLLEDYPQDKTINNYILYGNHDHKFIKHNYNLTELLKPREDLINIGTRKTYLTINNLTLCISHMVAKYKETVYQKNITGDDLFLHLKGHSHKYKNDIEKNNTIYIPTLSDGLMEESMDGLPGFLVIEFYDKYAIITNYIISNQINKDKELVKEIKPIQYK